MNKHHLKVGVTAIALVCLLWAHPTFAAGGSETGWVTETLNALLKFLSWGWMLLAFLAGKLMSNDFVYGSFLHLDSALFKLWNYMKNIANFILGFLFLFGILKSFFTKDAFEIKKTLPRYLLAGVVIQMSWFIMGAFVDLSNIATAAIGSFPTQFIQGSTEDLSKSKMMQMAVTVPVQVDVSFEKEKQLFTTHSGSDQTIEEMFGKFNDLSGPLLFMGASIFRFQDYNIVNADITDWKNFSIGLFIKLFILVTFCVPLFVLIVINLIRIFKLWIWITFSPLAAISWTFDDKSTPGVVKTVGSKLGFGKLSDVLSLIFQPVAMIGALSLVMIMSIGMYYVLGGDPGDQDANKNFNKTIEQVSIESKGEVSTLKDLTSGTEISVEGDLFKEVGNFVGGMIGYLIITGFTVILLWSLIKIGASFSKFTKGTADNIFKWSEKMVTNSNIIPLGGSATSLAAIGQQGKEMKRYMESGAYNSAKVDDQTNKLRTAFFDTKVGKSAQKTFGIDARMNQYDIESKQKAELLQTGSAGTNQAIEALRKIMAGKQITAQSKNFKDAVMELLTVNESFRKFMLNGAGISADDYEKNKANILSANNEQGQKMLQFLSYAVTNNLNEGSRVPNGNELSDFMTKRIGNSAIQSTTPLYAGEKSEKKDDE